MAFYIDEKKVKEVYFGSDKVKKLFVGEKQIYDSRMFEQYILSIPSAQGFTAVVRRTSSLNCPQSLGALSDGAVIFYGDELSITAVANEGYNPPTVLVCTFTVTGNISTSDYVTVGSKKTYTVTFSMPAQVFNGYITNNSDGTRTFFNQTKSLTFEYADSFTVRFNTLGPYVIDGSPAQTKTFTVSQNFTVYLTTSHTLTYSVTNAVATVNRTSSPYGRGSIAALYSGAMIFYGDTITYSLSPRTGYSYDGGDNSTSRAGTLSDNVTNNISKTFESPNFCQCVIDCTNCSVDKVSGKYLQVGTVITVTANEGHTFENSSNILEYTKTFYVSSPITINWTAFRYYNVNLNIPSVKVVEVFVLFEDGTPIFTNPLEGNSQWTVIEGRTFQFSVSLVNDQYGNVKINGTLSTTGNFTIIADTEINVTADLKYKKIVLSGGSISGAQIYGKYNGVYKKVSMNLSIPLYFDTNTTITVYAPESSSYYYNMDGTYMKEGASKTYSLDNSPQALSISVTRYEYAFVTMEHMSPYGTKWLTRFYNPNPVSVTFTHNTKMAFDASFSDWSGISNPSDNTIGARSYSSTYTVTTNFLATAIGGSFLQGSRYITYANGWKTNSSSINVFTVKK